MATWSKLGDELGLGRAATREEAGKPKGGKTEYEEE
jgi:hypothetical protein